MRNIADIIEDDKNGKELSQLERQIVVAYTQGKYDAVRELKMDGKRYRNALYGRIISCLDNTKQLDRFMVSLQNCIDIVWELAKIAKEEEYPEYFQDRVLDLLESYNIDYKHLGEYKDDKEINISNNRIK